MSLMGELAQASYAQRTEIMGLNEVPLEKIEEELGKIQDRYRIIYAAISMQYLPKQEYTNPNGKPRN